jgi:type III pantothenate kinase
MILAIDAGNSRIKWGCYAGGAWQGRGSCLTTDSAHMRNELATFPVPVKIIVSNVAGEAVRNDILQACRHWPVPVEWLVPAANQCGVLNGYQNPSQLGSDRWAALIAARGLAQGDCVVVQAGTAVTVDALAASGEFVGGLIVPGVVAMRQALAASTAAIGETAGQFAVFPVNTADAAYSGVLSAVAGAIERMRLSLAQRQNSDVLCLISGGDAELLLPLLSGNTRMVDNLVMEGLIRVANT